MNAKNPNAAEATSGPSSSPAPSASSGSSSSSGGMTILGMPAWAVLGGLVVGLGVLAWLFWPAKPVRKKRNPAAKRKTSKRRRAAK